MPKKKKALELMESVGLSEEHSKRKILKLSGGEQQRIAIARSLSYDPKIIIADEPTGNLGKDTEITTSAFLIYNKAVVENPKGQETMRMDGNGKSEPPSNGNMNKQDKNMSGQMGNNSNSITYSGAKEINEDTSIDDGEYTSEKVN